MLVENQPGGERIHWDGGSLPRVMVSPNRNRIHLRSCRRNVTTKRAFVLALAASTLRINSICPALAQVYSTIQIALMIAAARGSINTAANLRRAGSAVIRRADATKQKLISAIGQLSPAWLRLRRPWPNEKRATHLLMPPFRLTNRSSGSEFGLCSAA